MPVQDDGRPVVAGYDGSAESRLALRWAVEEARLRFLPLLVCHAWQWPYPRLSLAPETTEVVRRMGRRVLDSGLTTAHELAPRLRVRGQLVEGTPAAALVSLSRAAELIAIGPRGTGGPDELRIGSTVEVAAHARCPVAVVRRSGHPRAGRVAIAMEVEEATPDSQELAVAFEEARLRRAALLIICLCPENARDTRQAAVRFNTSVAMWEERYPTVEVETLIETRSHVEVLRHAADRSDLLVVADREHDDPVDPAIGPVCRVMLREAPCTIVVTPSQARQASPRRERLVRS
ncbi:universal stress protein [Streptosporangium sp. NPDC002721]|uniref:universal stress protein n=1 Tax=Streptosporangium sp. NPDC002721 TaxID=3366188 RepID=UPI0036B9F01F